MPKNLRNVRVDDQLWNAALTRSINEGTNLSALIREYLEDYASDTNPQVRRDKIIETLHQQGCTLKVIASVTDLSPSGVSRVLKRLDPKGP